MAASVLPGKRQERGDAAVTLLGLLFVAVSLRLNIFHQANVEDVRDFAAVTMITFLVALAIARLTPAPQQRERSLALVLFLIGAGSNSEDPGFQ